MFERHAQASHKVVERNVFNQLAIEHQVITQCLVNGLEKGRRSAKCTLVGVATHGGKRLLDRIDDHLDHIDGNSVEQAIDRAKVHIEGLAVDVCLARDGAHRNIGQGLIHEQSLKRRKNRITTADDTAVKARFGGSHRRVPFISTAHLSLMYKWEIINVRGLSYISHNNDEHH